jgi:cobalt-zinc-cadmium efflux system outer membrane protein
MESNSSRIAAACCIRTDVQTRARGLILSAPRWPARLPLLATLALASVLSLSARAAPARSEGLSLREAVEKALGQNKQLAAFRHRLAEQSGRLGQAGLLPNPQVDLLFENLGGEGVYGGFQSAETTLSIGWAIEPGIRGRRVGVERARSARTHLDAQILQLDVAAETAQRFLSCLESQAHLKATAEAVALGERTVAAVERRVRAGSAPNAELMRARAALATERLAHDDVTHERSVAYHRLAAEWGEKAPSFSRVDGELLDLPTPASFDDLAARIERNPELTRLASEQRIAEAQLRLAKARRWPALTPTLGARKFQITGDWALVAGVSVPLPLFDRNQGRVAESRAKLARTRADAEAERIRVRTTLFELYETMQHSLHRVEVLRSEVIPRFEETVDEMRRGYEKGRYPYYELATVQADLLAARRSVVEASTAAHRLVITLEQLTGESVSR